MVSSHAVGSVTACVVPKILPDNKCAASWPLGGVTRVLYARAQACSPVGEHLLRFDLKETIAQPPELMRGVADVITISRRTAVERGRYSRNQTIEFVDLFNLVAVAAHWHRLGPT